MQFDEQALDEVRQSRLLINRYDDWLFDEFREFLGQRMLEVGCGLGNQFQHLLDRELLLGLDISGESVSLLEKRFACNDNVHVDAISITDPHVLKLRDERIDTVLSVNVLEHVDDDDLALKHMCELLQPGGHLVLVVPAHMCLYGKMDASIGHYRRYTRDMLMRKLSLAGFEIVLTKYINMVGAVGWFVNGRILRREVPPRKQLHVLNFLVPMLQAIERCVHAPFGVSTLAIGRKPE